MIYEARIVIITTPFEAPDDFRADVQVAEVFRQFMEVLNLSQIKKEMRIQVRKVENV